MLSYLGVPLSLLASSARFHAHFWHVLRSLLAIWLYIPWDLLGRVNWSWKGIGWEINIDR